MGHKEGKCLVAFVPSANRSALHQSGKFSWSKSPEPVGGVFESFRPARSNVTNEFSHSRTAEEIEMDNRD